MEPEDKKPQGDDPIVNLKAEMQRKLGNLEQNTAQLQSALQTLIQQTKPKAPPVQTENLGTMLYEDADKAAAVIEERAVKKFTQVLDQRENANAKKQEVFAQLYNDYPELADSNNKFTQKTLEVYNALPAEDRQSPMAYKLAAREAASELGVKVKSKREPANDDDFSFGGGSSGAPVRKTRKDDGQDQAILETAKLFGLNVDDEKVKGRILGRKGRNFNKYE